MKTKKEDRWRMTPQRGRSTALSDFEHVVTDRVCT